MNIIEYCKAICAALKAMGHEPKIFLACSICHHGGGRLLDGN